MPAVRRQAVAAGARRISERAGRDGPRAGRAASQRRAHLRQLRAVRLDGCRERVQLLDKENLAKAVLYPTLGILWEAEVDDVELSQAYCRAYNRWIADFCRPYSDRLIPIAHLSLGDPQAAADELRARSKTDATARSSPRLPSRTNPTGIPITIRCSPPPRNSTCRSRSIRPSSRAASAARAFTAWSGCRCSA